MAQTSPDDAATSAGFVDVSNYLNLVRGNYCSISARVLFLWDYCATFGDEVRYVWGCRKTTATLLYLVNRYVNLAVAIMEILDQTSFQTAQSCGPFVRILQTLLTIVLFIAAFFATLRIYAIWDCNWRLALPVLLLAVISPIINIFIYSDQEVQLAPTPTTGCALYIKHSYTQYKRLVLANQASTVAYYGLALMLTVFKTMQLRQRATSRGIGAGILPFLLRDGTLYFLIFICINLAQMFITIEIAEINVNYLGFYVAPVTSLLMSRFLINLRRAAQQRDSTRSRTSVYLTSYVRTAGTASDKTGMGGPVINDTRPTHVAGYEPGEDIELDCPPGILSFLSPGYHEDEGLSE